MTEVYEAAGVWASAGEDKGWVKLFERGAGIELEKRYETVQLTPIEARRLARQLNRLARRVENKVAETS